MPVERCDNGKYRIGSGECVYTSRSSAQRAYVAYLSGQKNNKKRNMSIYSYKNLGIEIKDVDPKKRIVKGYFAAFDIKDADGDIIRPGAFTKTLNEMFPKGRIKHLLNHDPGKPIGKLVDLKEDSYGLPYESHIGTHFLGTDFIKMAESGLITEHSIGFSDLTPAEKRKGDGYNNITEVKLYEGSSLTAWGANEFTPLIEVKGQSVITLAERIKKFEKFARNSDATDETIESCLLYIKQLAQIIEDITTTDEEDSPVPDEPIVVEPTINISELKQFVNQWTFHK